MLFGVMLTKGNFGNAKSPLKGFDFIDPLRYETMVAEAKYQGHEIIFFALTDVDIQNKNVTGFVRKDGKWEWVTTGYPHLLISPHSRQPERTEKEKHLLKNVPPLFFRTHGKLGIFNLLSQKKVLTHILIPTQVIDNKEDIKHFLEQHGDIIVKPSIGSKGVGVYWLSQKKDYVELQYHTERGIVKNSQFDDYLSSVMENIKKQEGATKFILQKYIHCRTSLNQPFDFRVHVQRNEKGELIITKAYPRIGKKGSFLSNLSREGVTTDLDYFLQCEFPERKGKVKKELGEYSIKIAEEVDNAYSNATLDELGLDLTIDNKGNYWLFEINIGPETRFHEWERAQTYIAYACYARCKYEIIPHKEKIKTLMETLKERIALINNSLTLNQDLQIINNFEKGFKSVEEIIRCCYSLSYGKYLKETSYNLINLFEKANKDLSKGKSLSSEFKEEFYNSFYNWEEQVYNVLSYF